MIYDQLDDTNCASAIPFLPILTDHDIDTPGIDRPPIIVSSLHNQAVAAGGTVSLAPAIKGSEPRRCHWRFNADEILGETNEVLNLVGVVPSQAGTYDVVVTNAFGSATSTACRLAVSPSDGTPLIAINGEQADRFDFTDTAAVEIGIFSAFKNGAIFYTTDGSLPDFSSALYSGPFTVSKSAVLRAVAYDTHFQATLSEAVTVNLGLSPPTITVNGLVEETLNFTNSETARIEMASALGSAEIYYTLDGAPPTPGSHRYSSPFVLSQSARVRAISYTPDLGLAQAPQLDLWWM